MGERFARWLYHRLEQMQKKPDRILYNSAVREDLQALEPAGDIPARQQEYVIRKISLCTMIVVCGVVMSAILWIKEENETRIVDNRIDRNQYGDGTKSVSLVADDGEDTYYIPVDISERCYPMEELQEMSQEAVSVLEKHILGENQGFDRIEYDMKLAESVEGYPFTVEWLVDTEYMDQTGKLVRDTLEKPRLVELTAVLECESFVLEHEIMVMVHSKAVQPDQSQRIAQQVQDEEQGSRESQNMTLPSEIGGQKINWRYQRSYNGLLFLAATPLVALLVYYGRDRELHGKVVDREEQMRMDYPEIVSSLALLIGAGMTVPNAWNRIAKDYRKERDGGGRKRYAYEEMLLTVYEMESGVIQTRAYERFGRRCRIPCYNKLSTLLSQNMRKGSASLPSLLKAEAADAFEERKHSARKLGEKAGTKLLVPMMMLLGITMLIIMVPVFTTYL